MKSLLLGVAVLALVASAPLTAQAPQPFKLGTFERGAQPFVGVVLRDSVVIDFAAANTAVGAPASRVMARTAGASKYSTPRPSA
mgnify:CR=1 FL=1